MDIALKTLFLCTTMTTIVGAAYGPLPTIPFHVVWQVPSGVDCPSPAINISFEGILRDSGILWNTGDTWDGEYSTILYRKEFGYWPHYLDGEEPALNGGMPQLGNLTAHLDRARRAIQNAIPDPNFHGVACINMEQFRPLFERNWGLKNVYRVKSREIVRETYAAQNPSNEWVEEEAIRQFNYHAKKFMVESLRVGRELRPNGNWGYYHFPYCFNNRPVTLHCRESIQYGNDKMAWLWEESTAIMPSVYVFREDWSHEDTARYMYANIEEGIRVGNLVGGRPVYVYHKLMWNMTLPVIYYPQIVMLMGMRLSADFGVEGVILWSSQGHHRTKFDCERSYKYSRDLVIPYSKSLIDFTKLCSESRCSNRGRCVHRGTRDDKFVSEVIRTTIPQLTDWTIDDKYGCRCYPGNFGSDCSRSVSGGHNLKISMFSYVFCLLILLQFYKAQ